MTPTLLPTLVQGELSSVGGWQQSLGAPSKTVKYLRKGEDVLISRVIAPCVCAGRLVSLSVLFPYVT